MSLRKYLTKIFLSCAAAVTLAGCSNRHIGPEANTSELKGTTTETTIFPGGPQQHSTQLDAENLKANEYYYTEGQLTINGDIPPGVTLDVNDGKLIVNGNVGNGTTLNVDEPEITHEESDSSYIHTDLRHRLRHMKTVVDGLQYADTVAAVQINGACGTGVKINTNGGIVVNGQRQANAASQLKPYIAKP